MPKKFPYYQQLDQMDCGPTCLRMVAQYYGRSYTTAQLRELAQIGKDGVNLLGISEAAEQISFRSIGVKLTLQNSLTKPRYHALCIGNKTILLSFTRLKEKEIKFKYLLQTLPWGLWFIPTTSLKAFGRPPLKMTKMWVLRCC